MDTSNSLFKQTTRGRLLWLSSNYKDKWGCRVGFSSLVVRGCQVLQNTQVTQLLPTVAAEHKAKLSGGVRLMRTIWGVIFQTQWTTSISRQVFPSVHWPSPFTLENGGKAAGAKDRDEKQKLTEILPFLLGPFGSEINDTDQEMTFWREIINEPSMWDLRSQSSREAVLCNTYGRRGFIDIDL